MASNRPIDFPFNTSIQEEKNHFLLASREADQWFLMGSPWPVLSIVAAYLLFVLRIGPNLMKNRQPLNIKSIILVYNLYQIIFNAYMFSMIFVNEGALHYVLTHACHPMDPAKNIHWYLVNRGSWHFFFSKIMDLLDTVFFVLRKKDSQITFLHVYHHANMVLSTWAYLKYIKGEQGVIICVLNTGVHVIMYGYYFLAAFGPKMQKYLWWKRYITRLQMIQFLICIFYMAALILQQCDLPHTYSTVVIIQGATFFALFANFYVKTYFYKRSGKQQETIAAKTDDSSSSILEDKKEN